MLTIVGDDEVDVIELPNGMNIHIEFGIDESGPWGWRGRITGRYRRIQLFDKKDNLLSETSLKRMFHMELFETNSLIIKNKKK